MLKDFSGELSENSKFLTEFSTELKVLTSSLDEVLRVFHGADNRESLATRLKLLENKTENFTARKILPECVKRAEALNTKLSLLGQSTDNLGIEVNKLSTGISEIQKIRFRVGELEKDVTEIIAETKDEKKQKRIDIKGILMEVLKWILAIITAVIIAKWIKK